MSMCNSTCAVLDLRSRFHLNPDGEKPCDLIRGGPRVCPRVFSHSKERGVTQALDVMEKKITGGGF